jgi:hypothetical protein
LSVWRALAEILFLTDKRTNNSRLAKKGAEPQGGTTDCLKEQDELPAFIRKILVIFYEVSTPAFNLTKDSY